MDEKILTHVVVNGEEYQIGGGSDVDLSNYYTKEEVDNKAAFIKGNNIAVGTKYLLYV